MDENDFIMNFLNDLIEDIHLIKCSDLQSMINFCRENYDNWKDITLEYTIQIEKNTEVEFDINKFEINGDILFLKNVTTNDEPLTLKDLEDYLDDLKNERDDWGEILIMCDNNVEVNEEINQLPLSTFVDEENHVFSFIL